MRQGTGTHACSPERHEALPKGFRLSRLKATFQQRDVFQLLPLVELQNLSLSFLITPCVYFEYSQLALLKYFQWI